METYRENTVAIIRGDCCVRSSGILVDSFVLEEKLAQTVDKVYEDVEQTETDLEERVNNNITETSDSLEHKLMLLSSAVSLAMAKLPSTVTQNPEWSFVICDAEDKVVMGIKTDYSWYLGCTINELIDCVLATYTVGGATNGTFANKPTSPSTGDMYFCTDLGTNGKPIWYNGTNWVDATGTIVTSV